MQGGHHLMEESALAASHEPSIPGGVAAPRPPRGGIHLTEWLAEGVGTALLLVGGLSAICLDFGRNSPVAAHLPSVSLRLLLTGLLFGGTGSLVAASPLGRRSGGHLNPVVTLAFRLTGTVHPHDLAGYVAAQCGGAVVGAGLVRLAWRGVAVGVHDGATRPGPGVSAVAAVGIEALMTAFLVGTILFFVSRRRLARWTPLAIWPLVGVLVWQGARFTGTSLNPARSLGPALVSADLTDLWVYLAGPVLGAVLAAALALALGHRPLTGKLLHDAAYPTTMASSLPARGPATAPRPEI